MSSTKYVLLETETVYPSQTSALTLDLVFFLGGGDVGVVCVVRLTRFLCCDICFLCLHSVSCLNTARVSGLSMLCIVSILPVSLVCPFSVYCLNTACVSRLSILCVLSQSCMCL
jgi:hypothetical protein